MKRASLCLAVVSLVSAQALGVTWNKRPEVTQTAAGVRLEFIADGITDVTVSVLNSEGAVVRHLAAGRLGATAPAPLRKNAYGQSLLWDRTDDAGKPVPPGRYTLRTSLGFRPTFERFIAEGRAGCGRVLGMAVDARHGDVYILGALGDDRDGAAVIQVRDRNGRYLRTILPYPASTAPSRVGGLRRSDRSWVPRIYHGHAHGLIPGLGRPMRQTMAVSGTGEVLFDSGAESPGDRCGPRRIMRLLTKGTWPIKGAVGPVIQPGGAVGHLHLALSRGEQDVYVSGLRTAGDRPEPLHVVYRLRLDDEGAPTPWLGELGKAGKDEAHFDDPRGVAVDGAGNVYVADHNNDRICVFNSSGKWLGSIFCEQPDQIFVHPTSGHIYVLMLDQTKRQMRRYWDDPVVNRKKRIVKLRGWNGGGAPDAGAARVMAELDLSREEDYPVLTLDPTSDPPILWYSEGLWRIEDRGRTLAVTRKLVGDQRDDLTTCIGMSVDRARDEVYVDTMRVRGHRWARYEGRSGRRREYDLETRRDAALTVGGDGLIYVRTKGTVARYDRDGLPTPFDITGTELLTVTGRDLIRGGLAVSPAGEMYLMRRAFGGPEGTRGIDVYGADGAFKTDGLVKGLTGGSACLRVDTAGRVYVAEAFKPADHLVPEPLAGAVATTSILPDKGRNWAATLLGSVIRFGPKGGTIAKAGASARTGYVAHTLEGRDTYTVTGADWVKPGCSPMLAASEQRYWCRARFDVDGFGRLFVPSALTAEVLVLDPGGTEIVRVGRYGNRDDREDRGHPAFAWPAFVGVTHSACYVADLLNHRIARLTFRYAQTADVHVEVKK